MKKNMLYFLAAALIAAVAVSLSGLRAQNPPQPVPPPPGAPTPGMPIAPGPIPGGPRRGPMLFGHPNLQRAIQSLRLAAVELGRMTNELDGHRQAALDSCNKTIQELEAVLKADSQNVVRPMMPPPGAPPLAPPPTPPGGTPAAPAAVPPPPK